jgi:hypothetical protein
MPRSKAVIGRVEPIDVPEANVFGISAKVDTGAYRSSIWATNIYEQDDILHFTLLGPHSPFYSGRELKTKEYRIVEVESSFGHRQKRYSIFLKIHIDGKVIKSNFTLANRTDKTYPALIGRKLLKNRFIVDVSLGQPLKDEEVNGDNSLE